MPSVSPAITYPTIILSIIIIAFILSHYRAFTRLNPEMRIQQTEHPDNDTIYALVGNKLPTLFLYDVEVWDGFDLMIGYPYEEIKDVLKNNTKLVRQLKKLYLAPFSAPLTRDWSVELKRNNQTWNTIPATQQAITEDCYGGHYIAALSGLLCVCLINPTYSNSIWLEQTDRSSHNIDKLKNKTYTAKHYIDIAGSSASFDNGDNSNGNDNGNGDNGNGDNSNKPTQSNVPQAFDKSGKTITGLEEIEYITMPVRPSHVLYIPYGWHYYIYCGQDGSYACYLDLKNKTWL